MNLLLEQTSEIAKVKLNVEREDAAAMVVEHVLNGDDAINDYVDGVFAGAAAAIEEVDVATLLRVSEAIRTVASEQIEAEAKRLALQMIRDLAADNKKEEQVPF
jgi:hypothetical protein